jgi:hypothetical protein
MPYPNRTATDPARGEQSSDPLTCWMSRRCSQLISQNYSLVHDALGRSNRNFRTKKNTDFTPIIRVCTISTLWIDKINQFRNLQADF